MPVKTLTINGEIWQRKPKDNVARGKPLRPSAGIETRYYRSIARIIDVLHREALLEIKRFMDTETAQEYFAEDASIAAKAKQLNNRLRKKFLALFNRLAKPLAEKIVSESEVYSTASLKSSLKQATGGMILNTATFNAELKDIINASVATNTNLIKSIGSQYTEQLQNAVLRSVTGGGTGKGLQELIPFLQKQRSISLRKARLIAQDQTRKVYSDISRNRMLQAGVKKFEWLHVSGSNEPRPLHVKMSGSIYEYANPPIIDLKTEERGYPSQLINCFIGSTEVSLANGCSNLWRYFYSGQIVVLHISGGDIIRCTLNHPILTQRGWVTANEIQEGDYLASSKIDDTRGINKKTAKMITTFDNLFNSLALFSNPKTTAASKFDFYGDIPKNDVDAIVVNNMLPCDIFALCLKQVEKFQLPFANIKINFFSSRPFPKVIKFNPSCLCRNLLSLINRHFGKSNFIGAASVTSHNSMIIQNSSNHVTRGVVSFGKLKNTFATIIKFNNFLKFTINKFFAFNRGNHIIESCFQSLAQASATNPIESAEISDCIASIKKFHRVNKKSITVFNGHVYTMQTVKGWYGVTSTEIMSRNCRCVAIPIVDFTFSN